MEDLPQQKVAIAYTAARLYSDRKRVGIVQATSHQEVTMTAPGCKSHNTLTQRLTHNVADRVQWCINGVDRVTTV